ncbi:hypothetical protein F5Y16DRAFT_272296 [Xylariaceae sp. FL0255]|nr:hypothetical protein F5Y16DRAFT_272296 [Xylariaceae sp. FL0255]
METFHRFNRLPVELRLTIWSEALHDEMKGRGVVILEQHRVLPVKSLRSQLVAVNSECRDYALRFFYTLKLSVYRIPVPSDAILQNFFAMVSAPPDSITGGPFHNIESGDCVEGTVFISPKHDMFLISGSGSFEPYRSCGDNFGQLPDTWPGSPIHVEHDLFEDNYHLFPMNHASEMVDPRYLQQILNLGVVERWPDYDEWLEYDGYSGEEWDSGGSDDEWEYLQELEPHIFAAEQVQSFWHKNIFSDVRNHWGLWLEEDDETSSCKHCLISMADVYTITPNGHDLQIFLVYKRAINRSTTSLTNGLGIKVGQHLRTGRDDT